jgi:magnesium-transporting ATPase (P-type)
VGLSADPMLLGGDVEKMSDAELAEAAEKATLFARLSPAHKERVIRVLRGKGHVVGFMGDGINDAPALRAADVGISVDTATDIAKESADLILLEKDLMVLEGGVIEGRKVFANIVKYIRMGASSNFGNMFSVLGASAFLPFLPMAPIQVLTNNLLYDFSQVPIPATPWTKSKWRGRGPGTSGNQAVHSLHRPHQLDLRLYDFLRHALGLQLLGSIPRVAISDRLVRRVADDADAHHPRHSHQ